MLRLIDDVYNCPYSGFFGMVMIMWLGISLYRHLQCSGSRFLNQVTFVEEDEEEIVVVDVIVPHTDAAEILHVK